MKLNTNTPIEPLFFTIEQMAEITGLSVATIRRAVRIHREYLDNYINGSRRESA